MFVGSFVVAQLRGLPVDAEERVYERVHGRECIGESVYESAWESV
jgi:hypothetical protein